MPNFDLRGIRVAEYKNKTYGPTMSAGEAMTANIELKFTEGRLYAESTLAEYLRRATGGTISLGTKYIPTDTQLLMYGNTRTVRVLKNGRVVAGIKSGTKDVAKYVGVSMYAPDMIDGVEKYTCIFIHKALFGPPSYSLATFGESVSFQTPTTTGEFLANRAATNDLVEVAVADTEADAIAWTYEVMGDEAKLSDNADLSGIYIGSTVLSPAFAAEKTEYSCTTENARDYVTAIAEDANAAVAISVNNKTVANGDKVEWNAGENTVAISVTAQDDTTEKTYSVTVTKGAGE